MLGEGVGNRVEPHRSGAKVLRQVCAWCIGGIWSRLVWVEGSEEGRG